MSDGSGTTWYTDLFALLNGAGIIATGLALWIWKIARATVTREDADARYAMRGTSYSKDEADMRFANKESCALQHQFLTERFRSVEERVSREAHDTRQLIESLRRGPRRDEDPSDADFS